jgi:hypothetical protein
VPPAEHVYANRARLGHCPLQAWADAVACKLIAETLRHGKIVVMRGVDEPGPLGPLFRDGVHYVVGDALSGWSDKLAPASSTPRA